MKRVEVLRRIAAAVLTVIAGIVCGPTAHAQSWNLYTFMPSMNASAKRIAVMLDDISKETDGKLAIRMHMGGSLQINSTTISQAVADNVVQMGDDSFFVGSVPIGGVLHLPLLVRNYDEFAAASKVLDPYIAAAYAKKGVILLGKYHFPPSVVWSTKKLTGLPDLKGQKIRTVTPEQREFLSLHGATGVTIGSPEVAPALERGVIDGVLTSSAGGGVLWKDLLKFNYRFPVSYPQAVVIVNAEAFGKLPPDMQAKVRKIVAEAMPQVTQAMRDEEDSLTKKFAADGMTVTTVRPEEVAQVGAKFPPFWESWAKARGPEVVEALGKVRKAVGR
jgi:TRAP-type C4-dicarboxylate transport system substrate-binding protein